MTTLVAHKLIQILDTLQIQLNDVNSKKQTLNEKLVKYEMSGIPHEQIDACRQTIGDATNILGDEINYINKTMNLVEELTEELVAA